MALAAVPGMSLPESMSLSQNRADRDRPAYGGESAGDDRPGLAAHDREHPGEKGSCEAGGGDTTVNVSLRRGTLASGLVPPAGLREARCLSLGMGRLIAA